MKGNSVAVPNEKKEDKKEKPIKKGELSEKTIQDIVDGKNLKAHEKSNSVDLTRREMDIIIYLHRHQDRIVSKKELLTEVWHYADADIETRTVDIHMLKLRKKIAQLIGDTPFVNTIRGEGYRLEPEK